MTDTAPPETPLRRLTRSSNDRVIAGVCGGLADYTGIDPIVFRIGFVVAALAGGAGIAGYVLAWIFIPEEGGEARSFRTDRDGPNVVLLVVLVVAALPALAAVAAFSDRPWVLLWVLIFLPGIIGAARGDWFDRSRRSRADWPWRWDDRRQAYEPASAPVAPPAPPSGAGPVPLVPPAPPFTTAGMPPHPPPPEWRRHRRRRSRLGLLTMSAGLVVGGVLASIEASGAADLSAATVFPILLLVVAAGLLVGAWYGQARRLIFLGVILSLGAISASTADVDVRGGVGDRTWRPLSAEALAGRYSLGMGQATLDLRQLDGLEGTHHVKAKVGVGELRVLIPDDVDVEVTTSVGIGNAELPGRPSDDGFGRDTTAFYDAPGTDRLVLELRVGIGHLLVDQGARLFDGAFDLDNGFGPEVAR